jgi:CheY-like chemotaxis protein
LDFSKIEAGKMTIESVVFDLRELVEDILDLVALGAQKKGVELVYIMEAEVPERVTGDPMRLKQILLNLVGNALKFTESGQVLVRILPGPDRTGQTLLKFEVEDTGIGISEKDSKHLFQAFTQADGSTTRKFGGTGLGLVICRKLVSLMGGEMYFDSQPGVGSTFWFTAALQRAPDSQVVADKLRENCAGMRVLVAEFNDAQRVVLKKSLSAMNAQADTVSNLSALLQTQVFDPDNPYTHVIIDSVLVAGASRSELERLTVLVRNPAVRKILLVPLHRRDLIGPEILDLFPNQLSKPLRQSALIRSLLEMTRAYVANANDGVDDIAPISVGRILLVDDNEVNRKVVGSMLSRMNLEYDLACDGREAVDKFFTAQYDVVLMDCQMPVLDGYQATAEIKRRLEGRSEAVVVAMTANAMSGERERCLAAGFDEYLSKPLRLADLEGLLRRIDDRCLSANDSIVNKSEDHGSAFDESEYPLADNVYLNEFIDTCADFGPDVAEENISLLRTSFARSFTGLGDAIATGDAEQFAAVAHRLSSSCGAVGAARLLNICRYFESFDDQAKFDGAKGSLAQMLPRMQSVFDEFLILLVKQTDKALERLKKAG